MKVGEATNEYGTPISVHVCQDCGAAFTVCPPAGDDWGGCLAPDCASYDESRDADKMFDDPDVKIVQEPGSGKLQ